MPQTTRWTMTLAAATAVTLALVGCADTEEPDATGTATPAPTAGPYSLVEELGYLPAPTGDGPVHVQAADYERVGNLLGAPKPIGPDVTAAELTDWAAAATVPGNGPDHPLGTMLPDGLGWRNFLVRSDEIEAGLGVSFRNVLRYVENISPPDSATVMHGEYDPAAIDAALGPADDGVWVFGEELVSNPELMMVSPPVGAGVILGETGDGRLLLFRREALLRGIQQGSLPTLADDPAVLAVARALDAHGWYSAMLLAGRDFARGAADDLALEPFVAIGATVDQVDGGADVIRIAYVHDDTATAAANEEQVTDVLEQGRMLDGSPYRDRFELIESSVNDTVLLVTLSPQDVPVGTIWTVLMQQESLVTHR